MAGERTIAGLARGQGIVSEAGTNLASVARTGGTIVVWGDSTDAGVQTGVGTAQVENSWPTQLAALLASSGARATAQNRYGCGSGTWAAPNGLLGIDSRISSVGTWQQNGTLVPGGNGFGSGTPGDSMTMVLGVCNNIIIEWQDTTAGRAFTYAVDGGATTDVSTTGNYLVRRTLIPVPAGAHSITLAQKTGSITIRGIEAWDDTVGMPIRVINGGISGATSTQLANDSGTADSRLRGLYAFGQDVTIMECGLINDAVNAVPLATTRNNLFTLANAANLAKPGTRNIFRTPNPIGDNTTIRNALDTAVQVMREVASATGSGLIEIYGSNGPYENWVAQGLMSDTRHLNTAGNAYVAQRAQRALFVN